MSSDLIYGGQDFGRRNITVFYSDDGLTRYFDFCMSLDVFSEIVQGLGENGVFHSQETVQALFNAQGTELCEFMCLNSFDGSVVSRVSDPEALDRFVAGLK